MWLDKFLLSVTQNICDKVEELTGVTKFKLQKWLILMAWAFATVLLLAVEASLFNIVNVLLITCVAVCEVQSAEKEGAEFLENEVESSAGQASHVWWRMALIFALLFVWAVAFMGPKSLATQGLFIAGAITCYVAWAYVFSCAPRAKS